MVSGVSPSWPAATRCRRARLTSAVSASAKEGVRNPGMHVDASPIRVPGLPARPYSQGSTRRRLPVGDDTARARRLRWPCMSFREWDDRRVGDVVLAVGLGALQLFGTAMAAQNQPDRRSLDVFAVLLLGRRRARPDRAPATGRWRSSSFAMATTFGYVLLDYPGGPIWGTLIVGFYTVMTTGHRVVGYIGLAIGLTSMWWESALLDRPGPDGRRRAGLRRLDAGAAGLHRGHPRPPRVRRGAAPPRGGRRERARAASSGWRSRATCTTCSRTTSA